MRLEGRSIAIFPIDFDFAVCRIHLNVGNTRASPDELTHSSLSGRGWESSAVMALRFRQLTEVRKGLSFLGANSICCPFNLNKLHYKHHQHFVYFISFYFARTQKRTVRCWMYRSNVRWCRPFFGVWQRWLIGGVHPTCSWIMMACRRIRPCSGLSFWLS